MIKNKDIKGNFGRRLLCEVENMISECIQNCLIKIGYKGNFYQSVFEMKRIKQFFTKGVYTYDFCDIDPTYSYSYPVGLVSCNIMHFDEKDIDFSNLQKIKKNTYLFHEEGTYKFAKYVVDIKLYKSSDTYEIDDKYYSCKINFKFVGVPELVEQTFNFVKRNENEWIFKDMNGDVIKICDELVWAKTNGNSLYRGIATRFEEDTIITENNERIYVVEKYNNLNVMIVNNRIKFAGIRF